MIEFRAASGHMKICSELLTRAAVDLQRRGLGSWPPHIMQEEQLLRLAPESGWFLGWLGELPVATFCLMDEDPEVWPDDLPGEALYLHRLAVDPAWQGHGFSRLALDFAAREARSRGLAFLRLDTGADRQKLLDLYAACGFRAAGVRPLRHYTSARFERPLSPSGQT